MIRRYISTLSGISHVLRERLWSWSGRGRGRMPSAYRGVSPSMEAPDLSGLLAQLFTGHAGRATRKWTHFPALYDRYFSAFQGRRVRLLEIGISTGGSLEIWRRYFGAEALIVGLDLDPATTCHVDPPSRVYIGDQADPALLARVIADCGSFDIVIDDGSHVAEDQRATLTALWPALSNGGCYVIEDTMTSYLPGTYRGGYRRRGTAIDTTQWLIDDLHGWAHGRPAQIGLADLAAVHVHSTIIILEKAAAAEPRHTRYGGNDPVSLQSG